LSDFIIYKGKKFYIEKNTFYFQERKLKSIKELQDLFKFDNILSLDFNWNEISEIEGLENFPNLRNLNLKSNRINKISGLEKNIHLENVDLSKNNIKKIKGLKNQKKLIKLDLSENQIEKIENLEGLINLKKLNLNFNNISKIENLDTLSKLEELHLSSNLKITKIENLENLKNLKVLALQYASIKKIEGLSRLRKLERLIIAINKIPDELAEIEGLEQLINLKFISINSFNFNKFPNYGNLHPIILRFACIVKSNNFESIEDWMDIFRKFPDAFLEFNEYNSKEKVDWFIYQCSDKLIEIIKNILSKPSYKDIRNGKEAGWQMIQERAIDVFSREKPPLTLEQIVKNEPYKGY
jgi:Leucine-rich repeat (LRR) protein